MRRPIEVFPLKEKYCDLLWVAHLDVTDITAIYEVIYQAFQQLGKIDFIVSNAGHGLFGAAKDLILVLQS